MYRFLDFFGVEDWFGRSEPFGFNIERIVLLSLCILACCIVPILLRNRPKATRRVLLGLWIAALILDLIKYIFYNAYCVVNNLPFNALELPLWTCTIYLYALPLSIFSKNEKIKNACTAFLCSISMLGGFFNFLFPTDSVFSFMGLHTCLYHFILLITPLIMLISGYYKPQVNHFKGALVVFVAQAVPVYIFDSIFVQDYMFIYNGLWFGPLSAIAVAMPHRIVWTIVCLIGHVLVTALMLYLESLLTKNRKKSNN